MIKQERKEYLYIVFTIYATQKTFPFDATKNNYIKRGFNMQNKKRGRPKKPKPVLCFDMDGTIADLYGVSDWLSKLRRSDDSPYIQAEPMWDMTKLARILTALKEKGYEVRIISWLSKDGTENYNRAVRRAKRGWLQRYNFPADHIHLLKYGSTKANAVRHLKRECILIDDNLKVRVGWKLGDTINPQKENLLETLNKMLERA